jgi:hypothetical protein
MCFAPVGVAQLVADQLVGGFLVGNAQQGLGHAHQQHAFLAAQVVLAHEGLDGALVLGAGADPAHQVGGGAVGRSAALAAQHGPRRHPTSQNAYDAHMIALWICVVIGATRVRRDGLRDVQVPQVQGRGAGHSSATTPPPRSSGRSSRS